LIVAVAAGTLRALGFIAAGLANLIHVEDEGQVLKYPFDGLGHGNAKSPSDKAKSAV